MTKLFSSSFTKGWLLMAVFISFSVTVVVAQNKTDEQGQKQGYWIKNKPNGKIQYKGQFKDDIPYGKFKYYDKTGVINVVLEYVTADSVIGTHFHSNGKKAAFGYYVNKKKEGVWRFYDRKGIVSGKHIYANGLKNGASIIYNLNGSASIETFYIDDIENGYRKTYNKDGELLTEGGYKDGQMDGVQIIYRLGVINIKGAYKHAVRDGDWIYYDENGKQYKLEHYELGIKTN